MVGKDAEKNITEEQAGEPLENAQPEQEELADETGIESNNEVDSLIEEAVNAALAEQQDTVLRAHAEVQNMRRRCEQDVEKAHKYALEKFGIELLAVLDNLERSLQAVPDSTDEAVTALYEGVELTLKGFLESFAKFNIEQLDPEGEPFDPELHEAMSMVENDDVEPNTVLTVVQKGYVLNGRVLRPAMVLVAKGS